MKNLLLLHGISGNPTLNWYQYVAKKAGEKEYTTCIPQLPSSDKPNLDLAYEFLTKEFTFDKETVLVGHSSGASLALGILQLLPENTVVKRTILVAGFIDPNLTSELHKYISRSDYDNLFPKKWNWDKIRKSSKDFIIFYSLSDPFVQSRHAEMMKEKLNGTLIEIPSALHFSVTSGGERFKQFRQLLEKIVE